MAFAATVMGMTYTLVVKGVQYRKLSVDLSRATFLANEKMSSIKSIMRTSSEEGKFENDPGFRYEYIIEEQEFELQELLDTFGSKEMLEQSDLGAFMKEMGMTGKSATGITFKLLRYEVKIFYGFSREYSLEFYRGLGIF